MNVLLVEDDRALATGLRQALAREGYVVNWVHSGQAALATLASQTPDLVVLDLGLPDMDGISVLNRLRARHPRLPVLILTARAALKDRVLGLDHGADDYLPKPFELPELLARLRVLERRLGSVNSNQISVGSVSLDTASHLVYHGGSEVDLPRREYMLLKALMENAGRVQTRESLENKLYSWGEEVSSNALEVHVHHLRKKIGADFIKTVRGVGYTVKDH